MTRDEATRINAGSEKPENREQRSVCFLVSGFCPLISDVIRFSSAGFDPASSAFRFSPLTIRTCHYGRNSSAAFFAAATIFDSQSGSSGLNGNVTPRELFTIAPRPSARYAAFTSAAVPPCAP
jgi:hypothetical protein